MLITTGLRFLNISSSPDLPSLAFVGPPPVINDNADVGTGADGFFVMAAEPAVSGSGQFIGYGLDG